MSRSLLITLVVAFAASCTPIHRGGDPQLISLNIVDQNGISETMSARERLSLYKNIDFLSSQPFQKVVRTYGDERGGTRRSVITTYHPNGQPHQYLEVCGGRAQGAYREWSETGIPKLEASVIGGPADVSAEAVAAYIFDRICTVYDENGMLVAKIPYEKGRLDGLSTYYHSKGSVKESIPFSRGKEDGLAERFFEDGALQEQSNFISGVLSGMRRSFWQTGAIQSVESHKKGLLEAGEYYDLEGRLTGSIISGRGERVLFQEEGGVQVLAYMNGIQEGGVKLYDEAGYLLREWHKKNSLKHGVEIEYYPHLAFEGEAIKPQPKLQLSWCQDVIQGTIKTWYHSGKIESRREMYQNKKQGVSTAWYEDGALMLVEEYHDDSLIKGEYYTKGNPYAISSITQGSGIATIFDGDGTLMQRVSYVEGSPLS